MLLHKCEPAWLWGWGLPGSRSWPCPVRGGRGAGCPLCEDWGTPLLPGDWWCGAAWAAAGLRKGGCGCSWPCCVCGGRGAECSLMKDDGTLLLLLLLDWCWGGHSTRRDLGTLLLLGGPRFGELPKVGGPHSINRDCGTLLLLDWRERAWASGSWRDGGWGRPIVSATGRSGRWGSLSQWLFGRGCGCCCCCCCCCCRC